MFSVIAKENVNTLKVSKPIKLTKAVAERKEAIQDMACVAEVYHETVEPILEWLDKSDKKRSGTAPVGSDHADADVIQHQIDEHQVLTNDCYSNEKCKNLSQPGIKNMGDNQNSMI